MGKRSKSSNKEDEGITIKEKNDTKKIKKEAKQELVKKDEQSEKTTLCENNKMPVILKIKDKCRTENKRKSKDNKPLSQANTPNKKIIFDDNVEGHEVPIIKKKRENKKAIQPKEDEPTEEEIDQFCGEINDEDNVEYENWVKLIEEKLISNKKKT